MDPMLDFIKSKDIHCKVHTLFDVSLFNKKNAPVGAYAMCVCCPRKETYILHDFI
jgi:hypothetical protein